MLSNIDSTVTFENGRLTKSNDDTVCAIVWCNLQDPIIAKISIVCFKTLVTQIIKFHNFTNICSRCIYNSNCSKNAFKRKTWILIEVLRVIWNFSNPKGDKKVRFFRRGLKGPKFQAHANVKPLINELSTNSVCTCDWTRHVLRSDDENAFLSYGVFTLDSLLLLANER